MGNHSDPDALICDLDPPLVSGRLAAARMQSQPRHQIKSYRSIADRVRSQLLVHAPAPDGANFQGDMQTLLLEGDTSARRGPASAQVPQPMEATEDGRIHCLWHLCAEVSTPRVGVTFQP